MDLKTLLNWGSEIVFCLCGLVSFNAAWRGLQNEKCRIGTFVFWTILGLIFILGPYIPYALTGALLLGAGLPDGDQAGADGQVCAVGGVVPQGAGGQAG